MNEPRAGTPTSTSRRLAGAAAAGAAGAAAGAAGTRTKFKMKWCYAEAEFRKSGWCPFMQNPFLTGSTAIADPVSPNLGDVHTGSEFVFNE